MSKRFICDYCGSTGMGFSPDSPSNWVHVEHNPFFSVWHNNHLPPAIDGDYCSIECLASKIDRSIAEHNKIIEELGMPG